MPERTDDLERARAAVERQAWPEAYVRFHAVEPSALTPTDLEGLAEAAWWTAKLDESLAVRQRAYAAHAAAGDAQRAAHAAWRVATEHFFFRGEPAIGAGWLKRAERHLQGEPEGIEHGFLAVLEANFVRFGGDLDRALALAERATGIGQAFGSAELLAIGIHTEGLIRIAAGHLAEGVAQLDEAMTSVVAGELSDYFTGAVYCNVIEVCLQLADVRRASEWSEAARAWCESIPPESPYPGLCRINRAEVASLRGAWNEAEAEAVRASEELLRFNPIAAASAFYEAGEIRRRVGNLAAAEGAFARAHELGFDPQPGLALLRLAQGKAGAAHRALALAVRDLSGSPLRRAGLLAGQVEIALAAGEMEVAGRAADELDVIAAGFGGPALEAAAATARGRLDLAEDDVNGAIDRLRHACRLWQELRLPYEAAKARALHGMALRAAANDEDAMLELRAAHAAFERLGAIPDADAITAMLGGPVPLPRGLTAREVEVLRLVAAGKTNREIAAELVISEHTVARHLQNTFGKLDVSSRAAATAFAFEHGLA